MSASKAVLVYALPMYDDDAPASVLHARLHRMHKGEGDSDRARAAIDLLQEKWILHIVRSLLDGPKGFNELGREVGGCNPTTLAQRLHRLETHGLVGRNAASPRRCYTLTPAGEALGGVLEAIVGWATTHLG